MASVAAPRPAVCTRAELSISRSLDGLLTQIELEALSVHLSRCGECADFARRQQAQRRALQALARVPLPARLAAWRWTNRSVEDRVSRAPEDLAPGPAGGMTPGWGRGHVL
jgi:anti-sigma factor RsiW